MHIVRSKYEGLITCWDKTKVCWSLHRRKRANFVIVPYCKLQVCFSYVIILTANSGLVTRAIEGIIRLYVATMLHSLPAIRNINHSLPCLTFYLTTSSWLYSQTILRLNSLSIVLNSAICSPYQSTTNLFNSSSIAIRFPPKSFFFLKMDDDYYYYYLFY